MLPLRFSWILCLPLLLGCGNSYSNDTEVLDSIKEKLERDPCGADNKDKCTFVEIPFKERENQSSDNPVIMVVDKGLPAASAGLYKDRVLAHYVEAKPPKYYSRYSPSVRMPKIMAEILHKDLVSHPNVARSRKALSLGQTFMRKYRQLISPSTHHGSGTFNTLAELVPNARFVLIEMNFEHSPPICKLATERGLEDLKRFWKQRAEKLSAIAETHGVGWLNYSMGEDRAYVKKEWTKQNCETSFPSEQVVNAYLQSIAVLFESLEKSQVFVAQAAPYAAVRLNKANQPKYALDCLELQNRLRVGYLNLRSKRLSEGNDHNYQLLDSTMKNAVPCTDVFIRDGLIGPLERSETPVYFSALGFGHASMNISGTSFVTPIGLAYAVYLHKEKSIAKDKLLSEIRGRKDSPPLLTPFADQQFLNREESYINYHKE